MVDSEIELRVWIPKKFLDSGFQYWLTKEETKHSLWVYKNQMTRLYAPLDPLKDLAQTLQKEKK